MSTNFETGQEIERLLGRISETLRQLNRLVEAAGPGSLDERLARQTDLLIHKMQGLRTSISDKERAE